MLTNIKKQLAYLGCFIYHHRNHAAYAQAGVLIPTASGHNGDLKDNQMAMLSQLVTMNSNAVNPNPF